MKRSTRRALAWLVAATACGGADAMSSGGFAACSVGNLGVEAGASASRWRESGDDGRLLLRESGTLSAAAVAAQFACGATLARLRLHAMSGERDYSGVSTTGAPLTARSSIAARGIELQLLWPLATGAAPERAVLAVGGSIGWRTLDRRLHDAGIVRGYDERFQDLPLTADLRWQPDSPLEPVAELQLGTALRGRMRLRLPNADAATLELAYPWLARARFSLGGPALGGRWRLGLQLHAQAMGAGPSQALYRNGVPVAAALQPRTAQQSATVFANWSWALR